MPDPTTPPPAPLTAEEFMRMANGDFGLSAEVFAALRSAAAVREENTTLRARLERVEGERDYLRPAVRAFARLMEGKLRRNDHKTHWSEAGLGYLIGRLRDEVTELIRAVGGEGKEPVGDEAADVANFAMMIADNSGELIVAHAALAADAKEPAATP